MGNREMGLYWLEIVADGSSKLAFATIIIKAGSIDNAWKIAIDEIKKREHLFNEIVDLKMVAHGHKGVSIKETATDFKLYFDEKLERSWPKDTNQYVVKPKEFNIN